MATVSISQDRQTWIHAIGRSTIAQIETLGDLTLFSLQMVRWLFARRPRRAVLFDNMYQIGGAQHSGGAGDWGVYRYGFGCPDL